MEAINLSRIFVFFIIDYKNKNKNELRSVPFYMGQGFSQINLEKSPLTHHVTIIRPFTCII